MSNLVVKIGQISLFLGIAVGILFAVIYTNTNWKDIGLVGMYVGIGFIAIGALILSVYHWLTE